MFPVFYLGFPLGLFWPCEDLFLLGRFMAWCYFVLVSVGPFLFGFVGLWVVSLLGRLSVFSPFHSQGEGIFYMGLFWRRHFYI